MHRKLSAGLGGSLALLAFGAVPVQAQTTMIGQASKAGPPSVQIVQEKQGPIGDIWSAATPAPGCRLVAYAITINGQVVQRGTTFGAGYGPGQNVYYLFSAAWFIGQPNTAY